MVPIGKGYFYYNGEIYKKIKPNCERSVPRYNLIDKTGNRRWISKTQIESIIAKLKIK